MHRQSVRRLAMTFIAGAVVIVAAILPSRPGARAQSKGAPSPSTEWPTYGHDPGGARYSPLTEITPANVGRLSVAWVYHMKPTDITAPTASEADPEVADAAAAGRGRGRGGRGAEARVFPQAKRPPWLLAA